MCVCGFKVMPSLFLLEDVISCLTQSKPSCVWRRVRGVSQFKTQGFSFLAHDNRSAEKLRVVTGRRAKSGGVVKRVERGRPEESRNEKHGAGSESSSFKIK